MSHLDPGTGLTIRAMEERDLDRVIAIASSLPTAPRWTRSGYEIAISTVDGAGDGPRRIALAAENSGEVIGFAIARVIARLAEAQLAEIETIAIDGKAQGYGFGSSLLLATLEELKRADVSEVELEVRSSNEWALRIYERAGFLEVGRRRGYYQNPTEDAVLLRLSML